MHTGHSAAGQVGHWTGAGQVGQSTTGHVGHSTEGGQVGQVAHSTGGEQVGQSSQQLSQASTAEEIHVKIYSMQVVMLVIDMLQYCRAWKMNLT